MTRVHLAQLLRDLASAHDYAFFSAPDEYMPSEIDRYPAAWLTPPRLKEVEAAVTGNAPTKSNCTCCNPACGSRTPNAHGGSTKWSRRCSEYSRS